MAYDTALNILNKTAKRLGLITSDSSDPFGETDANWVQLCSLLEELGQEFLRKHSWSQLQKTHTFSTVNGTESYALPADFARLIGQTEWNRTSQLPVLGPVSPQGWQLLKGQSTSVTVNQLFRIFGDLVYLYPTPSSAETVAFEYYSRFWVKETGQASPNTDSVDVKTDTLHFDPHLLIAGLKLSFLEAKGFPTDAAQRAFDDAWAMAIGADGAAPVLSTTGDGRLHSRLLDGSNVPETGFGS